jgi:hypothetical protein
MPADEGDTLALLTCLLREHRVASSNQLSPKTLPRFLESIERLRHASKRPLWYRGCGLASYVLQPSLYRHETIKKPEELSQLEHRVMARFRQRSIPYHSRSISDDWEALFFMQHYGVPTRLLDWTENPLVALFFALASAESAARRNRGKVSEPAVIWVLDPEAWNQAALSHITYKGGPLTPGDEALKGYAPTAGGAIPSKYPVALHGAHNSPRIVSQRGVFSIFGSDRTPMEKLIGTSGFDSGSLTRLTVGKESVRPMREMLLAHGITESVIYPDLEGLALETKRHFGFER